MERYISITQMSHKTQITLSDVQYDLLRYESYRSGLPLAELVRRAIDCTYRPQKRPKVRGYEVNVGFWRQPDVAVVGRIEPYRGRSPLDRNERIDAAMQTRPRPAGRRRARPPPT